MEVVIVILTLSRKGGRSFSKALKVWIKLLKQKGKNKLKFGQHDIAWIKKNMQLYLLYQF